MRLVRYFVLIFLFAPVALIADIAEIIPKIVDKLLFDALSRILDERSGVYSLPWADEGYFIRLQMLWELIKR